MHSPTVARNARCLRIFSGLSQAGLAERIGRTQAWVSLFERGFPASDDAIQAIADALNVDVSVLQADRIEISSITGVTRAIAVEQETHAR
jgi:transcriptional regulator with XRE-family HTH domain